MQLNFSRHPGNRGMAGTAAELPSLVPSLRLSRKKCHGILLLQVTPALKLMDRLKKDNLQWECFYTSHSITLLIQIENHIFWSTYLWYFLKDYCSLTAEMSTLAHGHSFRYGRKCVISNLEVTETH